MALAQWGAGETAAHLARQRMCRGPNQGEGRAYCSCKEAGQALCGCGCRMMLPKFIYGTMLNALDQCADRGSVYFDPVTGERISEVEILCGPSVAAWYRPIPEVRATSVSCVSPPRIGRPGRQSLEYSPSGDPAVATNSRRHDIPSGDRKIHFTSVSYTHLTLPTILLV